MAYKTDEMIKRCLDVIKKHKCVFVEDIIPLVPFTKKTFYERDLHECDAIKSALENNKIQMKRGLRAKWYNNDNATTQIALYKLIGTDAELERLSISKHQIETIREQPLFPDENQNADGIPTDDGNK